MTTGYLHPHYAASLAEFGTPRRLPRSGGWILERGIPGWPYRDAMGCYPLFSCSDWSGLAWDLQELEGRLVSVALVTDPFGPFALDDLSRCFDVCTEFKRHFVTDLSRPLARSVHSGHRYNARRALKHLSVARCARPQDHLAEWVVLYDHLIARHGISGLRAFSKASFRQLFDVPGVELYLARHQGQIVAAHLWVVGGAVGYSHLRAMNGVGYQLAASYALFWVAMHELAGRVRWVNHGGGVGLQQAEDGLTQFKRGWATETRPVYFCGRILDDGKYRELASASGPPDGSYFPIYRAGEFT